ncbi:hypothetical protein F-E9_129 [Faustovirus]|nr:hypothetical protein F-E9_129 [Faustovirus]
MEIIPTNYLPPTNYLRINYYQQMDQITLNSDMINVIISMNPVSFVNVNQALTKRAFEVLEAETNCSDTECKTINKTVCCRSHQYWTPKRFLRFAKCATKQQFVRFIPKFLAFATSLPIIARTLYARGFYDKLELLAGYYCGLKNTKTMSECATFLGSTSKVVKKYLNQYGIEHIDIMQNSVNAYMIKLTKWAILATPGVLLQLVTIPQIEYLYAKFTQLREVDDLYTSAYLLQMPSTPRNAIIKFGRRCQVDVVVNVVTSIAMVQLVETIIDNDVTLERAPDDGIKLTLEKAYVLSYANYWDSNGAMMAKFRELIRGLATTATFNQIAFAFDQYVACRNNACAMPEIVEYRRNKLITEISANTRIKRALFETLVAWCCRCEDDTLALEMVDLGMMMKTSSNDYINKDSKIYRNMITAMFTTDKFNYSHSTALVVIVDYLHENELTDAMRAAMTSFAIKTAKCDCGVNEILLKLTKLADIKTCGRDEYKKLLMEALGPVSKIFETILLESLLGLGDV